MQETLNHINDLKEIRSMMEKSSRFISLSGLSGIFAGIFALLGAATAYWYLDLNLTSPSDYKLNPEEYYLFFFLDAFIVLSLAICSGIFFTIRQSKKKNQKIWDKTSYRLVINVLIPLAVGGFFCLGLLYHQLPGLIAPATLLFYGLALLNGSKYTLDDVRYLGYTQIGLGLVATFLPGHGLLFWAIGFGIMHIVYGTLMYFKYEK
ncbi:MAG: hypothetical protein ACK4ND_17235 [Cytophagaceae bacterium]